MADRLTVTQIRMKLDGLPGWSYENQALTAELQFSNHPEAIAFLVRLAFECERQNHHAEISNVWATINFTLRTHDAGDHVTEQDILLAHTISELADSAGVEFTEDDPS